jgi:hypothetical protein
MGGQLYTLRSNFAARGQIKNCHQVTHSTKRSHLLGRDDRLVRGDGEVDPGVGHQVRLELAEVDVERAVEPQRRRDGRDDLRADRFRYFCSLAC